MKQKVIILGSTGSIGCNSLQVISNLADEFEVVGLAAGTQWEMLAEQAQQWRPPAVALADEVVASEMRAALPGDCKLLCGPEALVELVDSVDCDCVVSAVVGIAGLPATLRAVELGRRVAIANKEPLVAAGGLLMSLARSTGAAIIPVDSEHSAVFQAMQAGCREDVKRIVLTASGGPFWSMPQEELCRVRCEDALNHPTWSMGPKVTIDSATMMNKALEIVEARWLFGLRHDQIDVVIHPESVVHSLVEFRDGSVIAQMSTPDMRMPIQYALTYPRRLDCPGTPLCLHTLGKMTFFPPDLDKFPSLRLGHLVAELGGTSGVVMNAANEEANTMFRCGRIGFSEIVEITEEVLSGHRVVSDPDLDTLLAADEWARRQFAERLVARGRTGSCEKQPTEVIGKR